MTLRERPLPGTVKRSRLTVSPALLNASATLRCASARPATRPGAGRRARARARTVAGVGGGSHQRERCGGFGEHRGTVAGGGCAGVLKCGIWCGSSRRRTRQCRSHASARDARVATSRRMWTSTRNTGPHRSAGIECVASSRRMAPSSRNTHRIPRAAVAIRTRADVAVRGVRARAHRAGTTPRQRSETTSSNVRRSLRSIHSSAERRSGSRAPARSGASSIAAVNTPRNDGADGRASSADGELPPVPARKPSPRSCSSQSRADHRLAVDLLERRACGSARVARRRECLERAGEAGVVVVHQDLQALAAALDVQDRLGPGQHDVRARLPRRRTPRRASATSSTPPYS